MFLVRLAAAASIGAAQVTPQDSPALVERAKAIHERVITADTHNDISPNNFTAECNYTMRLTNQVNLPKMVEGGLDVSFMIVYVGQGPLTPEGFDNAYRQAVAKFDAVHRADERDRARQDRPGADGGRRAADRGVGTKVAVIGIENGYPDRSRHQARQGVLRSRRAVHVARAQRPQPAGRLEYRWKRQALSSTTTG